MSRSGGFCQYLPSNKKNPIQKNKSVSSSTTKERKQFITSEDLCQSAPLKKVKKREGPRVAEGWKIETEKPKIDITHHNIFHIDSKIKEILSSNISTLPQLQKDLEKVLRVWQFNPDPSQKILAKQQAMLIRKRIQDIESTLEYAFYIFRTFDLIEEYREHLKKMGAKSFISSTEKNTDAEERMHAIFLKYLSIAQDYIAIEIPQQKPMKMRCKSCGSYDFFLASDDEFMYVCKGCSSEVEVMDDSPNFKDTDRVNMALKYTYTRKGHFIDAAKRFQGTQNIEPKKIQEAVSIIRREMDLHELISDRGIPRSVTKDQIYMFLSEQNLSSFYEDLNLIFHIITKEPCPDISGYLDNIYEDFDKLEDVLKDLQDDERTNSLNVNYKLYKLLQRRGYPCRKDDFYILKTKTKEDEHDEKMKQAFEILGWKWYPTF